MKTLTTRGFETAKAIANLQEFKTHGALSARRGRFGNWDSGRLSGEDLERYKWDMPHIIYAVFSYSTPIAWVTSENIAYKVKQRFSVTTSKHQGVCYLL